jgi:hypothetical protein
MRPRFAIEIALLGRDDRRRLHLRRVQGVEHLLIANRDDRNFRALLDRRVESTGAMRRQDKSRIVARHQHLAFKGFGRNGL